MTGADILDNVLGRLAKLEESSGVSFLDALNSAVEVVFLRLWSKRSDIVKKDLDVITDPEPFRLPKYFRGFAEDPYIVSTAGSIYKLSPLPSDSAADLIGNTNKPRYYRLTGVLMQLYPEPTEDYELKGQYFACPSDLTLTSNIPWYGLFDRLIMDAVVEVTKFGGLTALMANQAFMATLNQAVDDILASRTNPAPRRVKAYFF